MTKLLIGADPEVFVRNGAGQLISGHIFPCGTKENPKPVANGHVQNDGMALEFNVPPSASKKEFVRQTYAVIKDLNALVKATDSTCKLTPIPVADFGAEYISSVPEEFSRLGCNPDYNAYTEAPNPSPDAQMPFRTGSGHVHIGWTSDKNTSSLEHFNVCVRLVKELDYYLGLPSLLWDRDDRRRELYGQAGAFRPKPYGLEYRVLSNAWLLKPEIAGFVFERAQMAAVSALQSARKPLHERFGNLAREIINEGTSEYKASWHIKHQAIAHEVMRDRGF